MNYELEFKVQGSKFKVRKLYNLELVLNYELRTRAAKVSNARYAVAPSPSTILLGWLCMRLIVVINHSAPPKAT